MISFAENIWKKHTVKKLDNQVSALYVDYLVLHERTGAIALKMLREKQLRVRAPDRCIATLDHIINTDLTVSREAHAEYGYKFIELLRKECRYHGIRLFDLDSPSRGISHILAIEQGLAQKGGLVVCPDSHVSTLGAMGTLGLPVGSSECESVLATQLLIRENPRFFNVYFQNRPPEGTTSKDVALALLRHFGRKGAHGFILEFQGSYIEGMPLDGRLTLCNLAAETGAESALVTDYIGTYHASLCFPLENIEPQITWGTHPSQVIAMSEAVPASSNCASEESHNKALKYMGLKSGERLVGKPIQGAFIGSCGNASYDDLAEAAHVLKGRKIAAGVRAICVPASEKIRYRAERNGLHHIFKSSGFQWHRSGCAMCNSFNSPFKAGDRVISSSNRNYEGRQGPSVRTHLASPVTVAASALCGKIQEARCL